MRADGRKPDELRPVAIATGVQEFAEGSVLIETGRTRVLCAVSVEDGVPPFLRNTGQGWVTAEYSMLPRSTNTRTRRETTPRGRTQEIQRLIGRSLRAAVDMKALGERTLIGRLRRAAGRRRHADGRHHGRVRGRPARGRGTDAPGGPERQSRAAGRRGD